MGYKTKSKKYQWKRGSVKKILHITKCGENFTLPQHILSKPLNVCQNQRSNGGWYTGCSGETGRHISLVLLCTRLLAAAEREFKLPQSGVRELNLQTKSWFTVDTVVNNSNIRVNYQSEESAVVSVCHNTQRKDKDWKLKKGWLPWPPTTDHQKDAAADVALSGSLWD